MVFRKSSNRILLNSNEDKLLKIATDNRKTLVEVSKLQVNIIENAFNLVSVSIIRKLGNGESFPLPNQFSSAP